LEESWPFPLILSYYEMCIQNNCTLTSKWLYFDQTSFNLSLKGKLYELAKKNKYNQFSPSDHNYPPPKKSSIFCLNIHIELLFLVIQGFALKLSILLIDFFWQSRDNWCVRYTQKYENWHRCMKKWVSRPDLGLKRRN